MRSPLIGCKMLLMHSLRAAQRRLTFTIACKFIRHRQCIHRGISNVALLDWYKYIYKYIINCHVRNENDNLLKIMTPSITSNWSTFALVCYFDRHQNSRASNLSLYLNLSIIISWDILIKTAVLSSSIKLSVEVAAILSWETSTALLCQPW